MKKSFVEITTACGGVAAIAKHFGINQWAVRKWKKRIPAERCRGLVKLSNNTLSLNDLRPDLWDESKGGV